MMKLFKRHQSAPETPLVVAPHCSEVGCHADASFPCSYVNALGASCHTVWCTNHSVMVANESYCMQHAQLLSSRVMNVSPPDVREDSCLLTLLELTQEVLGELAELSPRADPPSLWQSPDAQSHIWSRLLQWGSDDFLYLGIDSATPNDLTMRTAMGAHYEGPRNGRPNAYVFVIGDEAK